MSSTTESETQNNCLSAGVHTSDSSDTFSNFNTYYKQVRHPRLVEVLTSCKVPSPCKVVSDREQPKSGVLYKLKKLKVPSAPAGRIVNSKSITLALSSNTILNRRLQRAASE